MDPQPLENSTPGSVFVYCSGKTLGRPRVALPGRAANCSTARRDLGTVRHESALLYCVNRLPGMVRMETWSGSTPRVVRRCNLHIYGTAILRVSSAHGQHAPAGDHIRGG